jgi:hypothetical protein
VFQSNTFRATWAKSRAQRALAEQQVVDVHRGPVSGTLGSLPFNLIFGDFEDREYHPECGTRPDQPVGPANLPAALRADR